MRAETQHAQGWGKINSGQVISIITTDLDRALAGVKWRRHELRIHQYVREVCWGVTRQVQCGGRTLYDGDMVCEINLYDLAQQWGVSHSNVCRAYRQLVKDNLLVEHAPGFCVPNKDMTTVAPDRFEDGAIEHAKLAWSYRKPMEPQQVSGHVPVLSRSCHDTVAVVVTSDSTVTVGALSPPAPPIGERAGAGAELNSIQREREREREPATAFKPEDDMPEPVRAAAAIFRASDHPEATKAKVPSALLTLSITGAEPHELAAVAGAMASARMEIDNVLSYATVCLKKVRSQSKAESANPPPVQRNGMPPPAPPPKKLSKQQEYMATVRATVAEKMAQMAKEACVEQG